VTDQSKWPLSYHVWRRPLHAERPASSINSSQSHMSPVTAAPSYHPTCIVDTDQLCFDFKEKPFDFPHSSQKQKKLFAATVSKIFENVWNIICRHCSATFVCCSMFVRCERSRLTNTLNIDLLTYANNFDRFDNSVLYNNIGFDFTLCSHFCTKLINVSTLN